MPGHRRKSKKSRARNGGDVVDVHGKTILTAPSAANAGGTTVVTRYEIDTNLTTIWAQYSALYNKWKIHWLKFTFIPRVTITTGGQIAMCVQEDPDAQTITTFDAMMNNRVATMGTAVGRRTLTYRPLGSGWLYTQDNALSVDRTEMPGDFNFATGSYTSAVSPGDIICEFRISFTGLTNSGAFKAHQLVEKLLPTLTDEQLADIKEQLGSCPEQSCTAPSGHCNLSAANQSTPARPPGSLLGAEREFSPQLKLQMEALQQFVQVATDLLRETQKEVTKLAAPD